MSDVVWFVDSKTPKHATVLSIINHILNREDTIILSAIGQVAVSQATRLVRWINRELAKLPDPQFVVSLPYMVTQYTKRGKCRVTKIRLISTLDLSFDCKEEFDECYEATCNDVDPDTPQRDQR